MSQLPNLVTNPVQVAKAKIAKRREVYTLFLSVMKILERFEGKRITAAIATAIKKEYPGLVVYFERMSKYNTIYNLNIWGGTLDYNDALRLALNTSGSGVFHMSEFKSSHTCYTLDESRIPVLESKLQDLPAACVEYQNLKDKILALQKDLGDLWYYII